MRQKPVRHVEPRQKLTRLVMMGDVKNPCWRYMDCGCRIKPIDVQTTYEGEKEDG